MRKLTLLTLHSLFLAFLTIVSAQGQPSVTKRVRSDQGPLLRCATMEAFEKRLQADPKFKNQWLEKQQRVQQAAPAEPTSTYRSSALSEPVTIPVIVHVVLPNPSIITEEQIDFLLNQLNLTYSGLNSDSANGAPFYSVRGHSQIRFARARRDPGGNLTNGVERKVGTVPISLTTYQAIKHSSQGGLDPWDVTKYYNLWVGDGGASGLLGIAPGIGVGGQTETTSSQTGIDGICVDYRAFSNGCFSYPKFSQAKTIVHEIGHNFGLYHTFSGCAAGSDFTDLTPIGQTLPASLLAAADDTPSQSTATTGCPTGTVASNCPNVPNPPGKMYQNYMDYTDDACYSMFTKGQVARMEYVLEKFRPGYLTSLGAVPPANAPSLDIAPTLVVSPGGSDFDLATCKITKYPTPVCPGSFTPRISVTNKGTATINSLTVSVRVNGGAPASVTVIGLNLLTGRSTTVALPAQILVSGANTITFTTSAPNGGSDQLTANDVQTTTVTIAAPVVLPLLQDFESPSVAPWSISNPNGDFTWVRKSPGKGSQTALFIDNWTDDGTGNIDDFQSPPIAVSPDDSLLLMFDLAHKFYPDPKGYDTLVVLVSGDCGATFKEVYKKWGPSLATAGSSADNYLSPLAGDWRLETINLGGLPIPSGKLLVIFRNKTRYGNNIFIDNISIGKKVSRDLMVETIVSPLPNICSPNFAPRVTLRNIGEETITSFKAGYRIDNGPSSMQSYSQSLAPNASVTVTLPALTTTDGNHSVIIFTADPVTGSGTGDLRVFNDTARSNFSVFKPIAPPVAEGFETSFPPAGWKVVNLNSDTYTWMQKTPGRNSSFSAFINNYDNPDGNIDELRLPAIEAGGRDSILFSFDVAHKHYPDAPDTLLVLASADCGNTFTPIYKKWGTALATGTSPVSEDEFLSPGPGDWRAETIALSGSQFNTGNAVFVIQNHSRYGNNIFVDNIKVQALMKRDLQVVSVNNPPSFVCSGNIAPTVTVKNAGIETITTFKVSYTVDGGAPLTTTVSGVSLAREASMTVSLSPANLGSKGAHTLKVFAFEPVTASGVQDQFTQNDTLIKIVSLTGTQVAPLRENFTSTTFAPVNWATANPDNGITWKYSSAGRGNTGSAWLNSFTYLGKNNIDELVTPTVSYSGVDSVVLSFDVAAAGNNNISGTTLDTLEVLVTTNCGATYETVYKKWGTDLQTTDNGTDPTLPQQSFIPASGSHWRGERIDLSTYNNVPSVQVVFRAITNNGNNIFLDNVALTTRVLPARLKERGYIILPNPFSDKFSIWHHRTPTTLKYVNVYDSKGQLVWSRAFNNNTEKVIGVDLSGKPAGIYIVHVGYEGETRSVSERVIKR